MSLRKISWRHWRLTLIVSLTLTVVATTAPFAAPLCAQSAKVLNNDAARLQEAQYLVQAYTALMLANHDYGGHRGKAAHIVRESIHALHEGVLKHGSAAQQAAVGEQHAAVVNADEAAKRLPSVRERQPASDAQLVQAQQLLAQLRPTLVTNNQQHIVNHVDRALCEIQIALQVR